MGLNKRINNAVIPLITPSHFLKLLLQGGSCPKATHDDRTPALDQPLAKLIKASAWGVTLPWNLCLCFFFGAWIMVSPSLFDMPQFLADANHVVGALIIVITMTSFSEIVRSWRYGNVFLATLLLIGSLFVPFSLSTLNQALACLAICLLSLRRGPIRESTTYHP